MDYINERDLIIAAGLWDDANIAHQLLLGYNELKKIRCVFK